MLVYVCGPPPRCVDVASSLWYFLLGVLLLLGCRCVRCLESVKDQMIFEGSPKIHSALHSSVIAACSLLLLLCHTRSFLLERYPPIELNVCICIEVGSGDISAASSPRPHILGFDPQCCLPLVYGYIRL